MLVEVERDQRQADRRRATKERAEKKGTAFFLAVSLPFLSLFPLIFSTKETYMRGRIGPRGVRVVKLLDVGLGPFLRTGHVV